MSDASKTKLSKIIKYGFFGLLTASLEFATFTLLLPLVQIYIASTTSFLLGLVASFAFNKFVVFKNTKHITKGEAVQFLTLGLVNSQLSSLATLGLSFLMPSHVAKILSMLFIAVWNFVIMNLVIFRKPQERSENTDKLG